MSLKYILIINMHITLTDDTSNGNINIMTNEKYHAVKTDTVTNI